MYAWQPPRTISVSTALAIVALIGAALVFGLRVRAPAVVTQSLVSVSFTTPPPPPVPTPPPPHRKTHKAKDQAAPQNIKNQATPIVAPPVVHPLIPPPVVAATRAGVGAAANTGASAERGPGQGAGGAGDGFGGGGDGGDGDEDAVVGPRQIRGDMGYRDLPLGILAYGQEAAVRIQYTVNPDGRPSNCRVTRSSGIPTVDALACRLLLQRYVFRPARDAFGRAVHAEMESNHVWVGHER